MFSQEEMRQIIGYIWARQYVSGNGNAERGHKVFAEKNCAACHNDASSGAPKLAQGKGAYERHRPLGALVAHAQVGVAQRYGVNPFEVCHEYHLSSGGGASASAS